MSLRMSLKRDKPSFFSFASSILNPIIPSSIWSYFYYSSRANLCSGVSRLIEFSSVSLLDYLIFFSSSESKAVKD